LRKVAVIGAGMTKFSAAQEKTAVELFAEAAMDAMNEANVKPKDIQCLCLGQVLADFSEGQCTTQGFCADSLGLPNVPATRYEGCCASASVAIRDAAVWVGAGIYDIILAGGTETAAKMGTPLATRTFAMGSDAHYEYPAGVTFPGVFAMLANLYCVKYGVPVEKVIDAMAAIAVKAHHLGNLNPHGQLHKEITPDMVKNAFVVAHPLTLYNCCPFSDGGAAVVVVSEEIAKKLSDKPMWILGSGQGSGGTIGSQKKYLPHIAAREFSAKEAYSMAGVSPKDICVAEVHDCFSIAEIILQEQLGFFEKGKSCDAVLKGETTVGGKIPLNPSGGLKSKGHPIGATGAAQAYEIYDQFKGNCGPRQVEPATKKGALGLTDTLGGNGGAVVNIIYQKGW